MNGFFLACAVVSMIPMAIHRDPAGSLLLAVNPLFWLGCSVFA